MRGWVYVITNEAMPGLVKVGFTTRDPAQRASDLDASGIPFKYQVAFALQVSDCRTVERIAHGELKQYKARKEWFKCSAWTAVEAVTSAGQQMGLALWCGSTEAIRSASPLPDTHALAGIFNPGLLHYNYQEYATDVLPSQGQAENPNDEEDDSPLPPGHPARGLL
ncbi:GIY-YIG nuclease family protein [Rubrivivax sp. A210]|uniref:GIY-YIG nuclease family protein n=1 Tax=Rubrivivax sp. A210 TaxID=2772301 RepID=UPI00191AB6C3|nr:GIY-YIG nuclease family protein [Rubrivivax sp. A210]